MKTVKKGFDILLSFELAIALLIAGCLFIPKLMGIEAYIVLSGSMEPELKTGSLAFVDTKVKAEDIRIKDIIAFKTDEKTRITHRVIEISETCFITKGDANETEDISPIPFASYEGKTLGSSYLLGIVCSFINSSKGKILLMTLFTIELIWSIYLNKALKNKEENQNEKI